MATSPPRVTRSFSTVPGHLYQFIVDRLDYQRASRDVYNRKAVGLLALQASTAPSAPVGGGRQGNRRGGDGVSGEGEYKVPFVCFMAAV